MGRSNVQFIVLPAPQTRGGLCITAGRSGFFIVTAPSLSLPAASSPRHAFNWLLVNGVFNKVCIIVHGAVSKRGETLPDSGNAITVRAHGRMYCHNNQWLCARFLSEL